MSDDKVIEMPRPQQEPEQRRIDEQELFELRRTDSELNAAYIQIGRVEYERFRLGEEADKVREACRRAFEAHIAETARIARKYSLPNTASINLMTGNIEE